MKDEDCNNCSVQANRKADLSGVVINTCGWVQAEGYDHIKHIAQVRKRSGKPP